MTTALLCVDELSFDAPAKEEPVLLVECPEFEKRPAEAPCFIS